MLISCKKAATLMDREDFEKLSKKEKISLKLHNVYCKLCRDYKSFSAKFQSLFIHLKHNPPTLSETEKTALKNNLK